MSANLTSVSSKLPPCLVGCFGLQADLNLLNFRCLPSVPAQYRINAGDAGLFLASQLSLKCTKPQSITWSVSGLDYECDLAIQLSDNNLGLSRGRFGRIPLYYYRSGSLLWFSTRLDALILISGFRPEIAPNHLKIFTTFSWFPAPLTPYAGIVALKPGEEVSYSIPFSESAGGSIISDDWGRDPQPLPTLESAADRLEVMLMEEAERQTADLHGEGVGVLLSGGLDSSLTAAALVRIGVPVSACCLDFGEYGHPETEFAKAAASHLNIPLRLIPCGPAEVWSSLKTAIGALDIPYGDGVTVPLFIGSREASRECGVLFNGEGGDQLFAGWANKPLIADSVFGKPGTLLESYLRTFHRFRGAEQKSFSSDAESATLDQAIESSVAAALAEQYPGEALLHRLRSLFCRSTLADWTFNLKPEWLLHNSHEKYILKLAVRDWLPDKLVWREKRGMGVPSTAWLTGPLWRRLGSYLHPRLISKEGLWNPCIPFRLVTGNLGAPYQGRRIGELLWLLLSLQAWLGEATTLPSPFLLPASFWQLFSSTSPEIAESLWQIFQGRLAKS